MNKVIMYVIAFFFLLGGVDYTLGNKLKLGSKFEEGLKTMGTLGISMIGIYCLAPVIAEGLSKILYPLSSILGFDPSIFPASILAPDMGGYQLSKTLAIDKNIGAFSAVVLSSGVGTAISFTIPLAIGMIPKEDRAFFSQGAMVGIITIPIGCLIAGLVQGIRVELILINLIPTLIISILLCIGLLYMQDTLIKIFGIIGKSIFIISVFGLIIKGMQVLLGVNLINGLASFEEAITVVGKIAFVLGGAYPMLEAINILFKKAFEKIGAKFNINGPTISGLIGNLASNLLVFGTFRSMNPKGKVICTAAAISGSFVFGGQLGFIAGVEPNLVGAFMISKFVACILSIIIASKIFDRELNKNNQIKEMEGAC